MDSPPSSEAAPVVRFLDASGEEIPAPREWMPALVELVGAGADWTRLTVSRNGEPLPVSWRRVGSREGPPKVVAEWPRTGAGNYRLAVSGGNAPVDRVVTVRPEKITQDAFAVLIEDLQARLPTSIAIALQRLGALAGLSLAPPAEATLAQELLRVERARRGSGSRPGLLQVLPALAADPHVMLRTTELWVRRHRARRPAPDRIAHALTMPGNVLAGGMIQRVVDTRVEESVDVYENRLARSFTEQVQRRLNRLISALRASTQARLAEKGEALRQALAGARRQAPFLREVTELATAPERVTMVLLRRPPYRAMLEGFLEFQRSLVVRLDDAALETPLEELPWLYQSWGTLQVLDALLEVAAEKGYGVVAQRVVSRGGGDAFVRVLRDGRPAVQLLHARTGTRVRLIPERVYWRGSGLRSLTFEQRPDVAIEVERPGEASRVLLFDPKYKLDSDPAEPRPRKPDIDKMHAYRDAIRDGEGKRVVTSAFIIYPGPEKLYADGIGALSGVPGRAEELKSRVREVLQANLWRRGDERLAASR